ncbi:hypothetical protein JAAARDRAFT_205203 [Jaapia argillacea MUCL 33604]|uniref:Uncharacterized protein n=1 Tax=Jaapia argillacea MUCL 33604 TaxID=933084 RepID=A0A067PZE4_9AGAM|nr:hypothetical protein JAAARDRAFT_205203 [Jaapia argillacea MUCL 33604]
MHPRWKEGLSHTITGLRAIEAAADFTPVPHVKLVAGLVLKLLESVDNVEKCKDDCENLASRTAQMVFTILSEAQSHGPLSSEMESRVMKLAEVLNDTTQFMREQSKAPFLRRFLRQANTQARIDEYRVRLEDTFRLFDSTSLIGVQRSLDQLKNTAEQTKNLQLVLSTDLRGLMQSHLSSVSEYDGDFRVFKRTDVDLIEPLDTTYSRRSDGTLRCVVRSHKASLGANGHVVVVRIYEGAHSVQAAQIYLGERKLEWGGRSAFQDRRGHPVRALDQNGRLIVGPGIVRDDKPTCIYDDARTAPDGVRQGGTPREAIDYLRMDIGRFRTASDLYLALEKAVATYIRESAKDSQLLLAQWAELLANLPSPTLRGSSESKAVNLGDVVFCDDLSPSGDNIHALLGPYSSPWLYLTRACGPYDEGENVHIGPRGPTHYPITGEPFHGSSRLSFHASTGEWTTFQHEYTCPRCSDKSLYSELHYYSTKPAFTQLLALGKELARKHGRPLQSIGIVTSVRNTLAFGGLEAEEKLYEKPGFLYLHIRKPVAHLPPACYWSESSEPGHKELFEVEARNSWTADLILQRLQGHHWTEYDFQLYDYYLKWHCGNKSPSSVKRSFQEIRVVMFSPLESAIAEILAPKLPSFGPADSVVTHAEPLDDGFEVMGESLFYQSPQ